MQIVQREYKYEAENYIRRSLRKGWEYVDSIDAPIPGEEIPSVLLIFDVPTENPDERDPDTKEDYLLKMDREAREEKRKRLGEFKPDKPRIEVGQLVWHRELPRQVTDIRGSDYILNGWIQCSEDCVHPCTHAEIMEFVKKANDG